MYFTNDQLAKYEQNIFKNIPYQGRQTGFSASIFCSNFPLFGTFGTNQCLATFMKMTPTPSLNNA